MRSKLELAIRSRATGEQIPCFERCQLTIRGMSSIKEGRYRRYKPLTWSMTAILRYSVAAAAVVRTRPRAIPLAMITMGNSIHVFPFLWGSARAAGAPL